MKEVDGLSIREIARRTGHDRNTVRRALRPEGPPRYERPPRPSKLDPFKDEIHRLLREDPHLPGKRVRELLAGLGYEGGKTILDGYLREVRPLFEPRRTAQRTLYRPGELLQFDLFEPSAEIPVGHGQTRRAWVVTAELGYSRAIAGTLVFSKEAPDLVFGMSRCLARLGALPEKLVWDREGAIHAGRRAPDRRLRPFLRRAQGRLADPGAARSAGQGGARALAPLYAHELRTRPRLRQRARLPAPARRLVRAGQPAHSPNAALPRARPARRKTLEEFDFTFQRSVRRQVAEHLGQLDFLHARDNVIFLGPPGTGKTHL
jgi:transposase